MIRPDPIELSVVIPMHNEEENVAKLIDELGRSLDSLRASAEIIVVDDASTDQTRYRLVEAKKVESRLRILGFARHEGQTAAIRVGIDKSRGPLIATLDGDGQNLPADLISLVDELRRTGADMVVGWRRTRQDKLFSRRFPSAVANSLIRLVTGTPIHDTGCTLKVMKSALAKKIPLPKGMHRFIPALAQNCLRAHVVEVEVDHRPRTAGRSKYGWSRLLPVLRDIAIVGRLSFPGWIITRLTEFLILFALLRFVFGFDPWLSAFVAVATGGVISILCWRRLTDVPIPKIDFDSSS
jgi:glycosyltransferase involved in cell wall biosynthesis